MPTIHSFDIADQLTSDGYAILDPIFQPHALDALINQASMLPGHAHRNLLQLPWARTLADSPTFRAIVDPILGPAAKPVRGILFDKVPGANWKVPFHQDLSIAVAQRIDTPGFGPWSVKEGVAHVQPPIHVLENMLTLRLHLDDCGPDNGPLRVLAASHRLGILAATQITARRSTHAEVTCTCPAGGILLMKPLLLHASSPAQKVAHRRVVHIEYAAATLAPGLQWAF